MQKEMLRLQKNILSEQIKAEGGVSVESLCEVLELGMQVVQWRNCGILNDSCRALTRMAHLDL